MKKEGEVEILLVEDDTNDAELAIMALKERRLANKLVHVRDGAEALDFLFATGAYSQRSVKDLPQVVLLDINMPKISGLEVLKKIRADERTATLPVVILTSSQEDKDVVEGYKLGVNSYIVKPVDFDKLMAAVSEIGMYWLLLNHPPG